MNAGNEMRSQTTGTRTYSVKDLVNELRVGRTMIYQLIKEGKLKTIHIGDRTLVAAEDLDAFIDSLRVA
jgi:excisionase family DNA binding protein